jgi:UDP-N-acetylglucosamine acyltransferase
VIDRRAVIDPAAELDEGVVVEPFAVIGPHVRIGKGTKVGPHAVIRGPCVIGRENQIFQFASIGEDPQDQKYRGETTYLEIGDRNAIREFTTIHRGTAQDKSMTTIGSDNLLMAYTHVAHDCRLGDNVIMANAASLGGHVQIDDWAILGGFTIVHQFCRIGRHAFAGMGSAISKDVPPYVMVSGHPAKPHGLNSEGLRRRGFDGERIARIKRGYRMLYNEGLALSAAREALEEAGRTDEDIRVVADFLAASERSIVR